VIEPTKIKITVRTGVMTEVGDGSGRATQRPPAGGLRVEAWDAGNRYYNFEWNGTVWQIRDSKVTLGWDEKDRPLPRVER